MRSSLSTRRRRTLSIVMATLAAAMTSPRYDVFSYHGWQRFTTDPRWHQGRAHMREHWTAPGELSLPSAALPRSARPERAKRASQLRGEPAAGADGDGVWGHRKRAARAEHARALDGPPGSLEEERSEEHTSELQSH